MGAANVSSCCAAEIGTYNRQNGMLDWPGCQQCGNRCKEVSPDAPTTQEPTQ